VRLAANWLFTITISRSVPGFCPLSPTVVCWEKKQKNKQQNQQRCSDRSTVQRLGPGLIPWMFGPFCLRLYWI
jgi:hypothetical protein